MTGSGASPAQIVQRAMSRLDKRGRGILLLHDIHPWTVAALPELLKQLKEHGYHVVQVVPPAPRGPLIAGGPGAWARAAAMPLPGLIDVGAVSPTWPRRRMASPVRRARLWRRPTRQPSTSHERFLTRPTPARRRSRNGRNWRT